MKKRLLAGLLALCILFSLVACGARTTAAGAQSVTVTGGERAALAA